MIFANASPISSQRIWLARSIAVVADVLQLAIFPAVVEGAFSPIDDGLDLVVGAILTLLLGWHIAFIPSFAIKLMPVADLAPTWTVAVLIVTGRGKKEEAESSAMLPGLPQKNTSARAWYQSLNKPGWTPSPFLISAIWAVLYPIIFFSFGYVFLQAVRGKLPWMVTLPFGINLLANVLFTPILFGLRNLWLAALDILLVLATTLWAINVIWPSHPLIAYAQLPYLIWVSIATVLQISIAMKNARR